MDSCVSATDIAVCEHVKKVLMHSMRAEAEAVVKRSYTPAAANGAEAH
jgi:hypothetical protein